MSRYSTLDHSDGTVVNLHERIVRGSMTRAIELLAGLGAPDDEIWPSDRWQPLVLDDAHTVGSAGGHGAVRYTVIASEPGRSVTFAFDASFPARGVHRFEIEPVSGDSVRWRHTLRLAAPLSPFMRLVVLLHDACLEDLLDQAEAAMIGQSVVRNRADLGRRGAVWVDGLFERRPEPLQQRRTRRPVAWATAGTLASIAVLHAVWGAGETWPVADQKALARTVAGIEKMPGPAACVTVAAGLSVAAGLVVARTGEHIDRRRVPFSAIDAGVRLFTGILAGRGALGLVSSAIGRPSSTPEFRKLNLVAYSPLCLGLAAALTFAFAPARPQDRR